MPASSSPLAQLGSTSLQTPFGLLLDYPRQPFLSDLFSIAQMTRQRLSFFVFFSKKYNKYSGQWLIDNSNVALKIRKLFLFIG